MGEQNAQILKVLENLDNIQCSAIRIKFTCLKFILKNLKINYQIKIFSELAPFSLQSKEKNKINIQTKRFYSSKINKSLSSVHEKQHSSIAINPCFITGFSVGESSFIIIVSQYSRINIGWLVKLKFVIGLHKKDKAILQKIKCLLGVGNIFKQGSQSIQFLVGSIRDLRVIIDHFYKYPLISKKLANYLLFRQAFYLISKK